MSSFDVDGDGKVDNGESAFASFDRDHDGKLSDQEIKAAAVAYLNLKKKLHYVIIAAACIILCILGALFGCMFAAIQLSKESKVESTGEMQTLDGNAVTVGKVVNQVTMAYVHGMQSFELQTAENAAFPVKLPGYANPVTVSMAITKWVKYDMDHLLLYGLKSEVISIGKTAATFASPDLGGVFVVTDDALAAKGVYGVSIDACAEQETYTYFCDTSANGAPAAGSTKFCSVDKAACEAAAAEDKAATASDDTPGDCQFFCTQSVINSLGGGISGMSDRRVCEEENCVLRISYPASTEKTVSKKATS
mmetsp:Transcript_32010/g.38752  ORF Transcript_32010/g.38752 Transcript_32010/m.38752 type:complete len:307 (-) Transcript_32010:1246-2166(-)|eukprot:CAMPEP_0197852720 /NCGR_PEP_ID=MMETSP1438-20131217/21260_1 /TAXON_ID=1461541 /ORGANISM="Pterosperma sp., Strain CCMP1384" /LENGTH=306 /DNA_ID=CAMNT_0043466881 /DNA_START=74 /DNA_END=994 /DNA_ORIENTATION=+